MRWRPPRDSGLGWEIQEVSWVGAQGVTSKSKLLAREMSRACTVHREWIQTLRLGGVPRRAGPVHLPVFASRCRWGVRAPSVVNLPRRRRPPSFFSHLRPLSSLWGIVFGANGRAERLWRLEFSSPPAGKRFGPSVKSIACFAGPRVNISRFSSRRHEPLSKTTPSRQQRM